MVSDFSVQEGERAVLLQLEVDLDGWFDVGVEGLDLLKGKCSASVIHVSLPERRRVWMHGQGPLLHTFHDEARYVALRQIWRDTSWRDTTWMGRGQYDL